MEPLLSIIIPTHNSESKIKLCLDSLISQQIPREQYEVIVVDDNSTDKTVLIAKESGADLVIITEPCFQGKARNIGVRKAKGELLAFIDSDCVAKKDWIRAILTELEKLDAVTGPIENGNSKSNIAWAEYLIEFGGWGHNKKRCSVRFLPGCNQAFNKKVFEKTGGFIETPSSEDVLFGESLHEAGINPVFVPTISIEHLCRTDKNKVLKNMKLLGKYFVKARRENSSLTYSYIINSRKLIPFLLIGKIIKTFIHSVKGKKFIKFIQTFPIIVEAITSFCKGSWEEIK